MLSPEFQLATYNCPVPVHLPSLPSRLDVSAGMFQQAAVQVATCKGPASSPQAPLTIFSATRWWGKTQGDMQQWMQCCALLPLPTQQGVGQSWELDSSVPAQPKVMGLMHQIHHEILWDISLRLYQMTIMVPLILKSIDLQPFYSSLRNHFFFHFCKM